MRNQHEDLAESPMLTLPSGTVTFLFTDIEGSTRLLQQHPQAMEVALTRHHEVLRVAVEAHNGCVFETLGDGVYAAFARASDAVAAALEGQLTVQAEDWGEVGRMRVRMGLHTGEVQLRGDHYVGPPLFRCARLMAIGYGGQTLLSRATRDLVGTLPVGASFRTLGVHHLKDLAEPTEVFQLGHPELPSEFPSLKSLGSLPNNLPIQPTRFIGRERELATLKELVVAERLVTLTAAGGAGKTRLALQVAADLADVFRDGVWLVDLAPLSDPALVPQTVASVLSVRDEPGRPLISTLVDSLRSSECLVLLDCCEHLVAACADLANTLLRSCSELHILATSREALSISGERSWRVASLSLPGPPPPPQTVERVTQYEAVRLFIERAASASPRFSITNQNAPLVAEICHRLDGIPLAIELAAARVRLLSVEQIATRLNDCFRFLTGGSRTALPRQQTLQALVDWSFELLSQPERVLFRRLSVFAGGWTLEAAEAICAGDGLESEDVLELLSQLVDKSLAVAEEHGAETRYRLLETIRQYANEKLAEAREAQNVHARHLRYFLALAEQAKPEEFDAELLARVDQQYDNLRAALRWSIDSGDGEQALRLAGALWGFWFVRGHYSEGRAWLDEILVLAGVSTRTAARARALHTASHLANCQGDFVGAQTLLTESRAISEELGDQQGVAASLHLLGNMARGRGDLETARSHYEEARRLNRLSGNTGAETLNLLQLAEVAYQLEDCVEARLLAQISLQRSRERGHAWAVARALHVLGEVAVSEGDAASAANMLEQSLAIQDTLGDQQGGARSLTALAHVALIQADAQRARLRYEQGLEMARASHETIEIARILEGLAELDSRVDPRRALRVVGAAGALRKSIGAELYPSESRRLETWLRPIYAAQGERICAEERALGRSIPLDQAIQLALEGAPLPVDQEQSASLALGPG